jgi:uncharacterized metal-binding protein YceD (DUF177 family)
MPAAPSAPSDADPAATRLMVSALNPRKPHRFDLRPDAARVKALAEQLELSGLRKLRLEGEVTADGKSDWRLVAHLGATVTQACVVTLEPVVTRIEEKIERRFLADWPPAAEQGAEKGGEVEMPEDESIDPLGEVIDLDAVMAEALALALPPYPRKEGTAPVEAQATPPGETPLTDADVKPFAGLAGLKKKLEGGGD